MRFIVSLRGVLVALILCAYPIMSGAWLAAIEVLLILTIVALNSAGPLLLGSVSVGLRKIKFLQTPQGAALLMVMPIKTLTALRGAEDSQALEQVALWSTIALMGLGIALGLCGYLFAKVKSKATSSKNVWDSIFIVLDIMLIVVLLMAGSYGEAIFGHFAVWLKSAFPILNNPSVIGLMAIIPTKTVSTLLLAGSWERRKEIAAEGSSFMVVIAALTFAVFCTSDIETNLSIAIGIGAAYCALLSRQSYRAVVVATAIKGSK